MITFGSLFTGIGGFDLGFEQSGMECKWQVEKDKFCLSLLSDKWPNVKKYQDIKNYVKDEYESVDIICGGDPCPCRSIARGNRISKHADLSGYFLAVVGRLQPRWMVRENVLASDDKWFVVALELLGYRTVSLEIDSADFTCQSRKRQFIIGNNKNLSNFIKIIFNKTSSSGFIETSSKKKIIASCLTAHPQRNSTQDNYIYEEKSGIRILSTEECELLQGFPTGWTSKFFSGRSKVMLGNAVTVSVAKWIAEKIVQSEEIKK